MAQRQTRRRVPERVRDDGDLTVRLTRYFAIYNEERPHQSLNYQTPDVVYASGEGGGAMIVNKR